MTDMVSATSVGRGQEAATILRNHLLSNISDENDALREDNESLDAVRECLAVVKILLGDTEIAVDLTNTVVLVEEDTFDADGDGGDYLRAFGKDVGDTDMKRLLRVPFHKLPRGELACKQVMVLFPFTFTDDWVVPLSDLNEGLNLARACQDIGRLFDVHHVDFVEKDENDLSTLIALSPEFALRGIIRGLGEEDLARFRNKEFGPEKLLKYLQDGTGLQAENATFVPMGLFFHCNPAITEMLELLRSERHECPPKLKQSDYELSRRKIITAISRNDDEMKILEENEMLQVKNNNLCAMFGLLGTVKVYHSAGIQTFLLEDGQAVGLDSDDDTDVWAIGFSDDENFAMTADDVVHHNATLSGTRMYVAQPPTITEVDGSDVFYRVGYHNGTSLMVRIDGSVEMTGDTPVKVVGMIFPFELVKNTLGILGLLDDDSDDDSDDSSDDSSVDEEEWI